MAKRQGPREVLVRRLRLAYASELAAARAYAGHWRSVRDPGQRASIRRIMQEELDHRAGVGGMLHSLGARPGRVRDAAMWCVGTAIAASCFVGGWYLPMYGAGRIERQNIKEYELAARLAVAARLPGMARDLLAMAEVEWDHERYFHDQVRGHRWHRRTKS
ncbi:MAG: ferritin-like domain-containing protein, partial [Halobacteriales archaeon]|nr:ferritin-like domain-containing protein [Halobacteriales archaeon]